MTSSDPANRHVPKEFINAGEMVWPTRARNEEVVCDVPEFNMRFKTSDDLVAMSRRRRASSTDAATFFIAWDATSTAISGST